MFACNGLFVSDSVRFTMCYSTHKQLIDIVRNSLTSTHRPLIPVILIYKLYSCFNAV